MLGHKIEALNKSVIIIKNKNSEPYHLCFFLIYCRKFVTKLDRGRSLCMFGIFWLCIDWLQELY